MAATADPGAEAAWGPAEAGPPGAFRVPAVERLPEAMAVMELPPVAVVAWFPHPMANGQGVAWAWVPA
ncbi:MAG: hypothetical protein ABT940_14525 [Alphaproteobacteria bacterium]